MDLFFTGSLDGFVRVFDSNKFTLKDKISVEASITKMIRIKELNLVVVGNCNGDIFYFDHRKNGQIGKLTSGTGGMVHDLVLYKEKQILGSFDDGSIKLF